MIKLLPGFVQQYQRHAVPQERTCISCLALDGKISDVDEPIESHPNCRCYTTPLFPGFDAPENTSGEGWLQKQSEQTQRSILGDARYQSWKDGTPLSEMVKITQDKTWGPTIGVKPLGEMGRVETNGMKVSKIISPKNINIDFASDQSQYVTDLGDVKKYFFSDDPGKKYAVSRPVYYNSFGSSHLTDEAHKYRLDWLNSNKKGLLKAIESPDFVERKLRARDDGFYSMTIVSELRQGAKEENRFMTIAISLSLDIEDGYHQITTIYPTKWKDLFYADGTLKPKYTPVK